MIKFRTPLPSIARRFVRSESGVAAPLLGLLMLLLIGFIGLAIDVGRSTLVKARLADALDAAGLAVGARLSTSDYSADAKKFVEANFAAGYAGATVKTVTATANSSKTIITLAATAEMPTAFMKLFGTKTVTVTAASEVTRASTGLELVLALDNTGSMSGSMTALKDASKDLLDIVFGDQTQPDNLFVGLVPFSQAVNIGTAHAAWMDPAYASLKPSGWIGCVEARAFSADQRSRKMDQTDDAPVLTDKSTMFRYYKYPGSGFLYEWLKQYNSGCIKQPVLPMTNRKATVVSAVNDMQAAGLTHVNLGAVWGWRMLSPRWRGFWSGDMALNNLPLDYNTPKMSKALVLLTDGANTVPDYGAYGELDEKRLGTDQDAPARKSLNDRLAAVCTSAKAAGVIIYTIVFNVPGGSEIETLMQNCATKTSFYFPASDEAKLASAFKTIGDSLSNLRVSK